MEDYKQKYKKAIEIAKAVNPGTADYNIITEIFPELKENEDEKIRKEIITYLDREITLSNFGGDIAIFKKWIAWLEKQGEHANFRNKIQIGDEVTRNEDGMLVNLSQFKRVVRQGEQKSTDKVKQKFKVGDKINMINRKEEDYTILTITNINMDEKCYICNQGSVIDFDEEREWYKIKQKPAWSEEDERKFELLKALIEDAKGDATSYSTMFMEMEELNNWLKSLKERMKGE